MTGYLSENPIFRWTGSMASFTRGLFEDIFKLRGKINSILDESPRLYTTFNLDAPPSTFGVYIGGETGFESSRARTFKILEASVYDDGLGSLGDECSIALYNVSDAKTVFQTTLTATTSASWIHTTSSSVVGTDADSLSSGGRWYVFVSVSTAGTVPFEFLSVSIGYVDSPALLRD